MRELARLALQGGHKRLDWTADGQNSRLRAFYDDLGGTVQQDKLFYRLSGEALAALADESKF